MHFELETAPNKDVAIVACIHEVILLAPPPRPELASLAHEYGLSEAKRICHILGQPEKWAVKCQAFEFYLQGRAKNHVRQILGLSKRTSDRYFSEYLHLTKCRAKIP